LTVKIGFDRAHIEPKIIEETDEYFTMQVIIAREMVQPYGNLRMLKAADELEKAYKYLHKIGAKDLILGSHPDTKFIMRTADVQGRVRDFEFANNLIDPKTKRPMDSGIKAKADFFKDSIDQATHTEIRQGLKPDVSIGFSYEEDMTPGVWRGQPYDGVQRKIYVNHLAAAVDEGRCSSPLCGLGLDSVDPDFKPQPKIDETKCPVCRRMLDIGLEKAGERLYAQYGADVLEVIEGNPLPAKDAVVEVPKPVEPPKPIESPAPIETPIPEAVQPPVVEQVHVDLQAEAKEAIAKSRMLLKHLV